MIYIIYSDSFYNHDLLRKEIQVVKGWRGDGRKYLLAANECGQAAVKPLGSRLPCGLFN